MVQMPLFQHILQSPYFAAALAFLAGCLFCGIFLRLRHSQVVQSLTAENDKALALAREKISQKEDKLLDLSQEIAIIQEKLSQKDNHLADAKENISLLKQKIVELETRYRDLQLRSKEKNDLLMEARKELTDAFKALSSDIFNNNSKSFLELAKETLSGFQEKAQNDLEKRSTAINELFKPIQTSLKNVDEQIRQVEKERAHAYAGLTQQIQAMVTAQAQLQSETSNLASALRTPNVRGRWGEIQLKRVVELAGMVEYCDFIEQESVGSPDSRLRPDMVIKLPNKKEIVVDSKAVLKAYLEALESPDEESRRKKLKRHAEHIRTHLKQLTTKSYWEQFQFSPEFVVLFLPGENFFSAALEQDPELIEFGVLHKVIIATPTTLIALLRAVSYGWRQERIAENAQAIGELGKTLFDRLRTLTGHFTDMRRGLERTVQSYNKAVGSYETRVLVTARKFNEIDPMLSQEIPSLDLIDQSPRPLIAENPVAAREEN